jgi:hypothetical protein
MKISCRTHDCRVRGIPFFIEVHNKVSDADDVYEVDMSEMFCERIADLEPVTYSSRLDEEMDRCEWFDEDETPS